jgi:uncharacterized protein
MSMPSPPPGWYPQAGCQRYWDGLQWTQHTAPLARSSSSNTWAVMSHLPVGSFIIPLLAMLIEGPKDEFVKYHSTESLNFHITMMIVALAGILPILFGVVTQGVEVAMFLVTWVVVFFGPIIFGVMGMIAANKGEWYRYPVAFRFIKGPTRPTV